MGKGPQFESFLTARPSKVGSGRILTWEDGRSCLRGLVVY